MDDLQKGILLTYFDQAKFLQWGFSVGVGPLCFFHWFVLLTYQYFLSTCDGAFLEVVFEFE
jgi:hypothetical protein